MSMFEISREWKQIERFKATGEASQFERALEERVRLVADSVSGSRRLRNLFGLRPVQAQELLQVVNDGMGIQGIWVAGKDFHYGLAAAEDLISRSLGHWDCQWVDVEGVSTSHVIQFSRSTLGRYPLDLLAIEHLEVPRHEDGTPEFIPYHDSLCSLRWMVVNPSLPFTYGTKKY